MNKEKWLWLLLFVSVICNGYFLLGPINVFGSREVYSDAQFSSMERRELNGRSIRDSEGLGDVSPQNTIENQLSSIRNWVEKNEGNHVGVYKLFRKAGFSIGMSKAIVYSMISNAYDDRLAKMVEVDEQYWKAGQRPYSGEEYQRLRDEKIRELEIISFSLGDQYTELEKANLRRQYGEVLFKIVNKVDSIERDYVNTLSRLLSQSKGGREERVLILRGVEVEKERELKSLLSPVEFREWELRASPAAKDVINNFREHDLTEDQYVSILDATRKFNSKFRYYSDDPEFQNGVSLGVAVRDTEIIQTLGVDAGIAYLRKNAAAYLDFENATRSFETGNRLKAWNAGNEILMRSAEFEIESEADVDLKMELITSSFRKDMFQLVGSEYADVVFNSNHVKKALRAAKKVLEEKWKRESSLLTDKFGIPN